MGLDIVELIMRIEEEYEIQVADEAPGDWVTCGDMFLYLARIKEFAPNWSETASPQAGDCASSRAFYRVRRALVEISGQERHQIGPKTPLNMLFPLHQRQHLWSQLHQSLGQDVPVYRGNEWSIALFPAVVLCPLLLPIMVGVFWPLTVTIYLLLLAFYIRPMLMDTLACPLNTVGDLSLYLLKQEENRAASVRATAQNQMEWSRFRAIIADETTTDEAKIYPTSRLVQDLNLD